MIFGFQDYIILELRDFTRRFFSTGNVLVDVWVGLILYQVLLSGAVFRPSGLPVLVAKIREFLRRRYKGHLQFEYTENSDFMHFATTKSAAHKAVMHLVTSIKDKRIKKLSERKEGLIQYGSDVPCCFELSQEEAVEVEKDVWVEVERVKETRNTEIGEGKVQVVNSNIHVFSKKQHSASELKSCVQRWVETFQEHNLSKIRDVQQTVFTIRFTRGSEHTVQSAPFHSFRSFDNLFFPRKAEILKEVDFFLDHPEWYQSRGLPWSLGILLYGEPGCGKTSFVKALLRKTGRHAVIFSINDATDLEVVESFMRSDIINDVPVPQSQRLYVLEDVDAMGRLVHRRKPETDTTPNTTASTCDPRPPGEEAATAAPALPEGNSTMLSYETLSRLLPTPTVGKVEESPVMAALKAEQARVDRRSNDLSFFLNLLDGIIEAKGRMVVMTTNHVHQLDEALIRPGRMDLRLQMHRCSRQTVSEIVGHFYKKDPAEVKLPEGVAEASVTPAEVSRVCRRNRRALREALEGLEAAAGEEE